MARRVDELAGVASIGGVERHVGRKDDELSLGRDELAGDLGQIADPVLDRLRERVRVQPSERLAPERVRPERLVRLQQEQELLELVEPVERGHRAREGACGGPEDAADPRPERGLAQPLQEAELHQHAVDGAAREHDPDVSGHVPLHLLSVNDRKLLLLSA